MKAQRAVRIFRVSNPGVVVKECIFFAVATLLLFNSGCAIRRCESTRINSFRPYVGQRIDGVEVRSFLKSRVALLLAGDHLPAIPRNESTVVPGGTFRVHGGYAAAIDHRGYFLTASRHAKWDTIYLIFRSDAAVCVERARVVWRGEPSEGQPDLAILHVPRPLDHVFEWTTNYSVGEPVMAVGLSRMKTNFLGPAFLGGTILEVRKPEGNPLHQDVIHSVPEQGGDTGGPLVARDGQLIGINYDGDLKVHLLLPWWWQFSTYAVHPDLEWLSDVIEKDAAAHSIRAAGRGGQY